MVGFAAKGNVSLRLLRVTAGSALFFLAAAPLATSQVFTVGPDKVDGHYLDFHPTNISLPADRLSERGREELIRALTAEQGFAMRPLPLASKGLTLHANGGMQPSGSQYTSELSEHGTAAKPGDRCAITDVKVKEDRIVLELNGGPDPKHKWLRHISLGTDPNYTNPVVQSGPEPQGARLTLVFPHDVPEVSGEQVKALLAPLLGFGVKSPVEAFTDTLPPVLKQAILNHHVLVGMSTEMVMYALGRPDQKIREREGQMPFEEWIYGQSPKPVEFVRVNGNRVIRIEIAEVGKPPVVHELNEMGNYWSTAADPNIHIVKLGDEDPESRDKQSAPQAPPTLREPGEKLPGDNDKNHPSMQPVQFPTGMGKDSDKKQPSPPVPTTTTTPQDSPQQPQFVASR